MITERSMNIIVTAGGTSEPIDNVRRIANTGTGRLGSLVADELAEADWTDHIFYVCAKDSIRPVSKRVTCVEIQSVADLQEAVTELTKKICDPWSRAQHGSQRLQSPFGIND